LEFIVRILFTGMMVFVPNSNNTQLDVVLLNVPHAHQLSDGTALGHHKPTIVARAGNCTGTCPKRDCALAAYLFGDKSNAAACDSLETAVAGGGAWVLSSSDVTLLKGIGEPDLPTLDIQRGVRGTSIIPTTAAQREDYTWLAKLSEICPDCGFNSDLLGEEPPSSLVAARFHLNSGKVFTYSVARIGEDITPVQFKRLDGSGSASSYSQAIASIIGVDIAVSGDSIRLVETNFDSSNGRTMTLTPDSNGRVEIAVLNLPPLVPASPAATPGIGKHFERYYDVTANPPAAAARLVPQPYAAPGAPSYSEVTWQSIHPQAELWSDLLNALRMNVSRSGYDITLCPPAEP
jgi:hypothetical protein